MPLLRLTVLRLRLDCAAPVSDLRAQVVNGDVILTYAYSHIVALTLTQVCHTRSWHTLAHTPSQPPPWGAHT